MSGLTMFCTMKATAIFASSLLLCLTVSCSRPKPAANRQTPSPDARKQQTNVQILPAESPEQSCRQFVQAFYAWYVRDWDVDDRQKKPDAGGTVERALKYRAPAFSAELTRMLNEDAAAQAKAHEIVGLDWDPIVSGQDINGRFEVRTVTRKGDRFFADVYEIPAGENPSKTHVIPELALVGQQWVFVNFHYPGIPFPQDENLLSVLKMLRKEREHPGK